MRFFKIVLAIISCLVVSCAGTTFTLHTSNIYQDYDFGRQYVAVAYELYVPRDDYVISGIDTKNLQGLTDNDVLGIHIVHQYVRYIPKKLLDWFKNINHLHIVGSELEFLGDEPLDGRIRYVHFDDNKIKVVPKTFFRNTVNMELISFERNRIEVLDEGLFRGLGNLKWISFAGNRIRVLPGTLFSTNPLIQCISFENNGITRVGAELVKDLTNLKGVSFDGNICINVGYWSDSNIREGLTGDFTSFCDGRCETIGEIQTQVYEMKDKVKMMEDKYPRCTYMRDFFWDGVVDGNESSEESTKKGGQKSMCPYAKYDAVRQMRN